MRRTRVGLVVDGRLATTDGGSPIVPLHPATTTSETPPLPDIPTLERIASLALGMEDHRAAQSTAVYFELEYVHEGGLWCVAEISIHLGMGACRRDPAVTGKGTP